MCGGREDSCAISVPSSQYCCEPKTTLKVVIKNPTTTNSDNASALMKFNDKLTGCQR